MSSKLLIICGPTATGKTKLAAQIARECNGELISADSRQIYKGMDIGTGKDMSDIAGIPITLIDVVYPDEDFSVSHYVASANIAIEDIQKRGKLPIVVGGTGFYINALIHPFETLDVPPNIALRKELAHMSLEALQMRLQELDSSLYALLNASDRANPRRLIRKIEIASYPGVTHVPERLKRDVLMIGLEAPLKELYARIDSRVEARVEQGVIKEIETLLKNGYSWGLSSMNALGYKQWKVFFEQKQHTEEEKKRAIAQWKFDEHAYARRQLTWFRKMSQIEWYNMRAIGLTEVITKKVRKWYTDHTDL